MEQECVVFYPACVDPDALLTMIRTSHSFRYTTYYCGNRYFTRARISKSNYTGYILHPRGDREIINTERRAAKTSECNFDKTKTDDAKEIA